MPHPLPTPAAPERTRPDSREPPGGWHLALIHGFAGSPAAWDRVVAALETADSPPTSVLRLSILGHEDANPDAAATFGDEVARLAATLAVPEDSSQSSRRPRRRWHLAGYSLGARLALGLALEHPELISHLSLIGVHPGLGSAEERRRRQRQDRPWRQHLRDSGRAGGEVGTFYDAWEDRPLFASQTPAQRRHQRDYRRGLSPTGLERALAVLGLARMPDYRPRLPELAAQGDLRVDLVVGELDTKFRTLAAEVQEAVPSAILHTVPGTGHNVPLESPETLAEILTRRHPIQPRKERRNQI